MDEKLRSGVAEEEEVKASVRIDMQEIPSMNSLQNQTKPAGHGGPHSALRGRGRRIKQASSRTAKGTKKACHEWKRKKKKTKHFLGQT